MKRTSAFRELVEMLWLSAPVAMTMFSYAAMQLADTAMIGRDNPDALAAVLPAGMLFFLFASILIGISSCNNTFASQSVGRGSPLDAGRYTAHAVYLGVMVLPLIVPLMLIARPLIALLGHDAEVQRLEMVYFRILIWRLAAAGITTAIASFFQGTHRPVIPMITGITANVLNVVGNYALIFGHWGAPHLGVFGAGLATVLASYVEVVLLLIVLLRRRERERYGTGRWLPISWRMIRQLLRTGTGSGATFALDIGSWGIFTAYLVGRLGKDALAGLSAANQIMHLSFMPTWGLNISVTALVARHIGEGDIRGAKRRAYLGMVMGVAYMSTIAAIAVILRRPLIGLFSEQTDVIDAGAIVLCYAALFQVSDAVGMLSYGALKGAGDTRFPAVVQCLLAFLFFLPLAWFLGDEHVWGIHGCWIAATLYIWIMDILLFRRFIGERWRSINIFR